jgi:hypothetical protein
MMRIRALAGRSGVAEQLPEHRFVVVAVVPLPHPFVQIRVEPTLRDRMVRPAHVVFEVPEEPFNRVRVNAATDIHTLTVVDTAVLEALLSELAVLDELVCVDHRSGQDESLDVPAQRCGAHVGNHHRSDVALALHHAEDRRLEGMVGSSATARRSTAALRAEVWNCDSDLGPVRAPSVARDLRN